MIRFVLSLAFSLAVLFSFAQNLVPNPSFEEFLECPFSTAKLHFQLVDWYSWQESPDFFHACSNDLDGFAGVPDNAWGSQQPLTGLGYAGLFTFADYIQNVREYIATPLMEPLVIGESYYMMFYASRCDSSEAKSRICATSNMGMRFFRDPEYAVFPEGNSPLQPDNFAHLNYTEVLDDSENWTLISGWFTADDAYNWVAIGNFFTDDQTEIMVLNDEGSCSGIYYIENVCVASTPEECDYLLATKSTEQDLKVGVFPNPASSFIRLTMPESASLDFSLFDSNGKLLISLRNTHSGQEIDVSTFQKGVYVARFSSNYHFSTVKLVLQ